MDEEIGDRAQIQRDDDGDEQQQKYVDRRAEHPQQEDGERDSRQHRAEPCPRQECTAQLLSWEILIGFI